MTVSAILAMPGMQGFDADTVIDAPTAAALKQTGFGFAVRYLTRTVPAAPGDLSAAELTTILNAGLAAMAVQHCPVAGWSPTAALGTNYGSAAVANAIAAGLPQGVSLWLDLEGVAPYATAADTIAYVNAWAAAVSGHYLPGLYVGANQPLTASDLFWRLRVKNYWKSASDVPEVEYRGYQLTQAVVPSPIDGISIDRNVIMADNFGGIPVVAIGS